jgi:two-component system, NarL family, response regulator DesR
MMPPVSSPSNPEISPIRVLLADDAARVRSELRQLLELSGKVQVVGEAGDGLEAIRLNEELSPQVIVMDLEMPGMDGYQATRQIKAFQPAPRVVILSVHGGPAVEERLREVGADHFVIKGTNYQILLNAILGLDEPINSHEKGEE